MMNRHTLLLVASLLGVFSCASQKEAPETTAAEKIAEESEPASADPVADQLAEGTTLSALDQFRRSVNSFAFDLHKNLPGGNVVSAPLGVFQLVALTSEGVESKAQSELVEMLRIQSEESNVHAQMSTYIKMLEQKRAKNNRPFTLRSANQIWAFGPHEFTNDFLKTADRFYGISPKPIDTTFDIEAWNKSVTGDVVTAKPTTFVSDHIVLTNASFVRGAWLDPFRRGATQDADFQTTTGKKRVPFLNGASRGKVLKEKDFVLFELPFSDSLASVWIVAPSGDLSPVESRLDRDYFEWALNQSKSTSYTVSIPRFEIDTAWSLKDAMTTMGAQSVFDPSDDPWKKSVIEPEKAHLSSVVSSASFRFDEHGVYGAEVKFDPAPVPADALNIVVDRPFLVIVRDNIVGTILMTARVTDPLP